MLGNKKRKGWASFGFGTQSYVWKHRPVKLVYSENYSDIRAAINREKQLKGWCRKKKEALIDQNYEELYRLANLNKSLLPPVSLR